MKANLMMNFSVDKENKKIKVEREFGASLEAVWDAWTTKELLDKWWAPKPFQAKTKSMDFREGGMWLYAMVGPNGEAHWCRADYQSIHTKKSFSSMDAFCDENAKINEDFPRTKWNVAFRHATTTTVVNIELEYKELADLEKILEMGFKEGFTAGMENLDEYFESLKSGRSAS